MNKLVPHPLSENARVVGMLFPVQVQKIASYSLNYLCFCMKYSYTAYRTSYVVMYNSFEKRHGNNSLMSLHLLTGVIGATLLMYFSSPR